MSSASPSSVSSSASPVTDFVVSLRPMVAYVLLALGLASFIFGGIYTAKVVTQMQAAAAENADKKPEDAPTIDPLKPKEGASLSRPEHLLAAIGGFMLAVIFGGIGMNTLFALPPYTEAERRRDARRTILLVGGLTGLAILTLGLSFFILYFGTLVTWISEKDKPPPEGTWKILSAILGMVLGAGLAFLAAQPARADERHQPTTRRMIYGMNFALSTLLLLTLLLVGNIIVSLKVPNKLDTTAAGINSITLAESTKEYLIGLTTPVTIYSTIDSNADVALDARRLLEAVREQNPAYITIKTLSKTVNKDQISDLRTKYNQADLSTDGLLMVVGTDEKNYAYLQALELAEEKQDQQTGSRITSFVGEQKLMKELLFLTQNKEKPVIYFTTGHGELEVLANPDPMAPPAGPGRTAARLRTALEKGYVELRPLSFAITAPKVPDDCSVLVILDPTKSFNENEVLAINDYLSKPNAAGKTGRMILASSPSPNLDKSGVLDLMLDDVIRPYGVGLGNQYVLNAPLKSISYTEMISEVIIAPGETPNGLTKELGTQEIYFSFPMSREIDFARSAPRPGFKTVPFMRGIENRITWLEDTLPESPSTNFRALLQTPELQQRKQAERGGRRIVGVYVSEGDKGKMIVFGSGAAFADPVSRDPVVNPETSAQLFTASLNFLRDQPQVANITAKTYGTFSLTKGVDLLRLVLLPFLMMGLTVLALGVGIWVVRRK